MIQQRLVVLLTALVALGLAIAGCGPGASVATTQPITVKTTDYAFDAPDQVNAGIVSIKMENNGKEPHHMQLARLPDGKTIADLQAALGQGEEAALALLEFAGGPSVLDPGKSGEVVLNLREGNYVLMCFVSSADGTPHFAKGMLKPMTVVAGGGNAQAPSSEATITLKDFEFVGLPAQVSAGKHTWEVKNEGPQPHEAYIVKLAAGQTMDDVGAFFQNPVGPPPFESVGGMQALQVGKNGWMVMDFQPGNYIALCAVPDPATGKPHAELGMVMPFTVQ
jgi:uncharacterized cupredoxin-like copper-binding protein